MAGQGPMSTCVNPSNVILMDFDYSSLVGFVWESLSSSCSQSVSKPSAGLSPSLHLPSGAGDSGRDTAPLSRDVELTGP